MVTINNLILDLKQSKKNVRFCLEHATGLADMHGLAYWARRVEALRQLIKEKQDEL